MTTDFLEGYKILLPLGIKNILILEKGFDDDIWEKYCTLMEGINSYFLKV